MKKKKVIALLVSTLLGAGILGAYGVFAFIPGQIQQEVGAKKNTQANLASFPDDVFKKLTASGALTDLAPGSVRYQLHCRNGKQLMTYAIEHRDVFKAQGVVALDALGGFAQSDAANSVVIERGADLYTKAPSDLVSQLTALLEPAKAPSLSDVLASARVAKTVCEDLNTRQVSPELPYWLPAPLVGELLASLPDPALHGAPSVVLPAPDSAKTSVNVPAQFQEVQGLFGPEDAFVGSTTSVLNRKIIGEIEQAVTWTTSNAKPLWNTAPFKLVANQFTQVPRTDYVLDLESGVASFAARQFKGPAQWAVKLLDPVATKSALEPQGKPVGGDASALVYHGCQPQSTPAGPRFSPSVQLASLQANPASEGKTSFELRWLDLLAMKASLAKPDESKMALFTAPELMMLTAPSSALCSVKPSVVPSPPAEVPPVPEALAPAAKP